jgi:polysaccharide deacetylase family protein (PEP-CTERM system associated)
MSSYIFSVDVEDWFHILDLSSTPPVTEWANLPGRVEHNFNRLLEVFATYHTHVTCFFLGWIAERYPHLVRAAALQGHEIASHGYDHQLVYKMTQSEFGRDVVRSKRLLEDIAGCKVTGYRAPGFSCTGEAPWFFEELVKSGYLYDTSMFPARRGHGGIPGGERAPHTIVTSRGNISEVPATVARVPGGNLSFFGGGYLRLFPMWLIRRKVNEVTEEGLPAVFYIHPREIDPDHPRLPMSASRRFKSYCRLKGTEEKVRCILSEWPMTTFEDFLNGGARASGGATLGADRGQFKMQ